MDELELLPNFPFISVEEIADLRQVNQSTARRHLDDHRDDGQATYHDVGRGGHLVQRWANTRQGVLSRFVYPERVPWWLTEGGLRSILRRVEWHSATHRYVYKLFRDAKKDWFEGDPIPALVSCGFIRGPRNLAGKWLRTGGSYT